MRAGYIVQSTLKQIQSRKGIFILSFLLICTAFLVAGFQSILLGIVYYQKYTINRMIKEEQENVFVLNLLKYKMVDLELLPRFEQLNNEIRNIEGIKYSGIYSENLMDINSGSVDAMYISSNLLPLCQVRDEKGEDISFQKIQGKNPIYVGYNLKDMYPVGYEFLDEYTGEAYVVKGVLAQNSQWIQGQIDFAELYVTLDNYVVADMDKKIETRRVLLTGLDTFCYVIDDDANAEQIKNEIFKLADDCGLDLYSIINIDERLENNKMELYADAVTLYMAYGMLVLSVVTVVISAMISIYLRKSSIGVMYAIGYSVKDVKKMVVLENAIKIFMAYMVAYAFWSINERNIYLENISILRIITPFLLFGIILLVVISSVLPIKQLSRMYPATLIGGKE